MQTFLIQAWNFDVCSLWVALLSPHLSLVSSCQQCNQSLVDGQLGDPYEKDDKEGL